MRGARILAATMLATLAGALSGCAYTRGLPSAATQPVYPKKTLIQTALNVIPPPSRPVAVAVYGFSDQTGQFKPSDTTQTLSRAVTQGAGSILVKALQDAGNRQWFTIVEREQLRNLLNERQIIREMRERYLGETNVNPQALPALLFAGVLLEGGIIGYDTNTLTGGLGASFLGIGAHTEYQQHTATVYLRAVSVRTGEVLTSVTTSKTIASYGISASAFRYVAFKELLEAEGGVTTNEPGTIALQQAIEKAVYGLVMEGVELKLWEFQNPTAGEPFLLKYRQERDGKYPEGQVAEALRRSQLAPKARQVRADEPARGDGQMPPAPRRNGG
jgi:curli production assembly/transport component CsgG